MNKEDKLKIEAVIKSLDNLEGVVIPFDLAINHIGILRTGLLDYLEDEEKEGK